MNGKIITTKYTLTEESQFREFGKLVSETTIRFAVNHMLKLLAHGTSEEEVKVITFSTMEIGDDPGTVQYVRHDFSWIDVELKEEVKEIIL
jgi:hypothetical protein